MADDSVEQVDVHDEASIEAISEIAQERRRAARAEIETAPPDFIVSTERAEVLSVFRPIAIPLKHINMGELSGRLEEAYNLDFDTPNLAPLLNVMSREQLAELSVDDAVSALIARGQDVVLSFSNGRFSVDKYHFVSIDSVTIDYEKVLISVAGPSRVAELVLADVIEAVWASTGTPKHWTSVQDSLLITHYATRTRIKLPGTFEAFLSDDFRSFIDDNIIGGDEYGKYMAGLSARHDFKPSPDVKTVFTLDELHCYFHHFDMRTGRSTRTKVQFSVTTRDEYGTGYLVVDSELPYEQHVSLLSKLVADMR